jgi:hypothetical protein
MENPMTESDFRKYFNRGIKSDPMLKAQLDFKAQSLRSVFILEKHPEIMNQKDIYVLTVPSHHHFFKIAREQEIQRIYFGKE